MPPYPPPESITHKVPSSVCVPSHKPFLLWSKKPATVQDIFISQLPPSFLTSIQNVHRLSVEGASDLNAFYLKNLHTVVLKDCRNMQLLSALCNVQSLNINRCSSIQHKRDIPYFSLVKDLTLRSTDTYSMLHQNRCTEPLQCVESLSMGLQTRPIQVNSTTFPKLRKLYLVHTEEMREVKILAQLPRTLQTVRLVACDALTEVDLELLQNIPTINISSCKNLRSLPALKFVERLDMDRNLHISTISNLPCLQSISVHAFKNLTSLSKLPTVNSVDVSLCVEFQNVSNLRNISSLRLLTCPRVESLEGIEFMSKVVISRCPNVEHIATIGTLRSLTLSGCHGIVSLPESMNTLFYCSLNNCRLLQLRERELAQMNAPQQAILFALRGVCEVHLEGWEFVDVTHLSECVRVDLSNCWELKNVNCLARVLSLNLSMCVKVQDVSALRNLYELDLSSCDLVQDVSMLAGVHDLNLSFCRSLRFDSGNMAAMGQVYSLRLCGTSISDVRGLGSVHTLDLSACQEIHDVTPLRTVHTLFLDNCFSVESVSMLGTVHTLSLAYCSQLTDFSNLHTVHTLDLTGIQAE